MKVCASLALLLFHAGATAGPATLDPSELAHASAADGGAADGGAVGEALADGGETTRDAGPVAELDRNPPVYPDDTGAEIWASRCAACHGPDGRARTAMGVRHRAQNLASRAWQNAHTDAEISEIILSGVAGSMMHSYRAKMTPEQLERLVRVVRGLRTSGR